MLIFSENVLLNVVLLIHLCHGFYDRQVVVLTTSVLRNKCIQALILSKL
jgi:hypothetical protein